MGAWGYGPFDSDGGMDLLDDLAAAKDHERPASSLHSVLDQAADEGIREYEEQGVYAAVGLVAARLSGYKGEGRGGTNLFAHLAEISGDTDARLELASEPLGLDAHCGHVELITEQDARSLAPLAARCVQRLLEADEWIEGWDSPDTVRRNLEILRALLTVKP